MDLKAARKKVGKTQIELSDMTGISQTSLSQIETGVSYPRKGTQEKIEEALGIKVDWAKTRFSAEHSRMFGRGGDSAEDGVMSSIYEYIKSGQIKERPARFEFLRRFISSFEKVLEIEKKEQDQKLRRKK